MNKIITIVGGLAIAVIFAVVLVWPQYQKFQVLNFDIKNKRAELQFQEAYFSQVKEISAELQEHPDALSKIANALPEDPSLASLSLVNFLQTKSAQTGLILEKIVLGGAIASSGKKGSWAEAQFVIYVAGSYKSFKDFLALIENSARMIEVQDIAIEIPTKEKSEEALAFTVNLKTFSY